MSGARYALVLAYDGSAFAGWQRQVGRPSVQGALEAALGALAGDAVPVTAAGRTDAGVHAAGQVVHFDMRWSGTAAELGAALNALLPAAVAVRAAARAPASFHARHSALARRYHYRLWQGGPGMPGVGGPGSAPRGRLIVAWMAEAAGRFLGTHDFAAFGRPVLPGGTTLRRVDRCAVWGAGPWVVCEVEANAFLRHQVRRMVAALVDVGLGRAGPEAVSAALVGGGAVPWPGRVPAAGLTLMAVRYPPQLTRQLDPRG